MYDVGQKVRYIGKAQEPGIGTIGTVDVYPNYDIYTGERLTDLLAFNDGNDLYPVEQCDLEII